MKQLHRGAKARKHSSNKKLSPALSAVEKIKSLGRALRSAETAAELKEIEASARKIPTRGSLWQRACRIGTQARLRQLKIEGRPKKTGGISPVSEKQAPAPFSAVPPFHPLADLFPLIEGDDFDGLCNSIKESNGPRESIVLHEGMILDGRNRARACQVLGIEPRYSKLPDRTDPLAFVLDKNLHRRHLDDRQRASVAGKIASLGRGGDRSKPPIGGLTVEKSAELLNVAPRQVERARVVHQQGAPEVREALDRGEIALSVAEDIARLPVEDQPPAVAKALPNGARAIMGSRQEAADSLDYSPTPPHVTRALIERVLPVLNVSAASLTTVYEPACGEGHMAEVLREYFRVVAASDINDRGYGHALRGSIDFLDLDHVAPDCDWIITNPPFKDKAEQFVLKAIELAKAGVAIFARLQWLETIGRYDRLFRDQPPTLIAFFTERVNLCMGRWEPDGSTATAYIWLVWIKGIAPRAPLWIPPGCRKDLSKPDDVERFTAHPVIMKDHCPFDHRVGMPPGAFAPIADGLNIIPDFLLRGHASCAVRDAK